MIKIYLKYSFTSIIIACLVSLSSLVWSQVKGDYNWQLGLDSSPEENPHALSMEIDFNNKISVDTFYRPLSLGDFNTSYSDEFGNLLLYSNGCQIRDGNHRYIEGSNHLNPGSVDDINCIANRSHYTVSEAGIFLPFYDDSLILLVHQRLVIESNPTLVYVNTLFYTILKQEGDSYTLIEKSIPIIDGFLTDGNLEAVKAGEPNSWWVLQGERASNKYFAIKFTNGILDTIIVQSIGEVNNWGSAGQAAFSPSGSKFARYNLVDDLSLFDFDRETGLLSNYLKIHVVDSGNVGGLAFSPNGKYLYVCARHDMYQFDIEAVNIQTSKLHLGHYDGYLAPFPATFYHLQIGPDCRIYGIPSNGSTIMHLIKYPNRRGLACEFEQHGFNLPVGNSVTLPNFPNYRLDIAAPCDSSIIINSTYNMVEESKIKIFPNPSMGEFNIEITSEISYNSKYSISIYNLVGSLCFNEIVYLKNPYHKIILNNMLPGVYFLKIVSNNYETLEKIILSNY